MHECNSPHQLEEMIAILLQISLPEIRRLNNENHKHTHKEQFKLIIIIILCMKLKNLEMQLRTSNMSFLRGAFDVVGGLDNGNVQILATCNAENKFR